MALTPRRILLGTGLACLALAAALLPPAGGRGLLRHLPWSWYLSGSIEGGPALPDSLTRERERLYLAAQQASREWLSLSWRDSVQARRGLVASARGRDPVVLGKVAVPPRRVQALETLVARMWQRLPRRDPHAWTIIAIIPDSMPDPRAGRFSGIRGNIQLAMVYPLVERGGCILLVSESAVRDSPLIDLMDDLAFCGWGSAFGPPSESVRRWLEEANWLPADYPAWDLPSGTSDWRRSIIAVIREQRDEQLLQGPDQVERMASYAAVEGRLAIAGCLRGVSASCVAALTSLRAWERGRRLPGLRQSHWVGLDDGVTRSGLLPALLNEVGPERFAGFWTTAKPVSEAFHDATGVTLGEWIRERVRARLGLADRGGPTVVIPALSSLLLGLVFAAVAILASGRRQIQ
jgi:hypothetical protein